MKAEEMKVPGRVAGHDNHDVGSKKTGFSRYNGLITGLAIGATVLRCGGDDESVPTIPSPCTQDGGCADAEAGLDGQGDATSKDAATNDVTGADAGGRCRQTGASVCDVPVSGSVNVGDTKMFGSVPVKLNSVVSDGTVTFDVQREDCSAYVSASGATSAPVKVDMGLYSVSVMPEFVSDTSVGFTVTQSCGPCASTETPMSCDSGPITKTIDLGQQVNFGQLPVTFGEVALNSANKVSSAVVSIQNQDCTERPPIQLKVGGSENVDIGPETFSFAVKGVDTRVTKDDAGANKTTYTVTLQAAKVCDGNTGSVDSGTAGAAGSGGAINDGSTQEDVVGGSGGASGNGGSGGTGATGGAAGAGGVIDSGPGGAGGSGGASGSGGTGATGGAAGAGGAMGGTGGAVIDGGPVDSSVDGGNVVCPETVAGSVTPRGFNTGNQSTAQVGSYDAVCIATTVDTITFELVCRSDRSIVLKVPTYSAETTNSYSTPDGLTFVFDVQRIGLAGARVGITSTLTAVQ